MELCSSVPRCCRLGIHRALWTPLCLSFACECAWPGAVHPVSTGTLLGAGWRWGRAPWHVGQPAATCLACSVLLWCELGEKVMGKQF